MTLNLNITFGSTPFVCAYRTATRLPMSFRDECLNTARVVHAQAAALGRIPYVLLSGGLDSEVVVKAFLEVGLPFRTITFRYAKQLNHHETSAVARFLERHNVPHEFYELDAEQFALSAEAEALFLDTHCSYFEMVPTMKLMQVVHERGGLPVLGNGEVLYARQDRQWKYIEYEYDLAWYRFEARYKVPGVMGFFQHTPEMMLAMMNEPRMLALEENRNRLAVMLPHSREIKYSVYFDHWPDLERRRKFDGGELTRKIFKPIDKRLTATYAVQYDDTFTLPLAELRTTLTSSRVT
jgi:hypothetical protein